MISNVLNAPSFNLGLAVLLSVFFDDNDALLSLLLGGYYNSAYVDLVVSSLPLILVLLTLILLVIHIISSIIIQITIYWLLMI